MIDRNETRYDRLLGAMIGLARATDGRQTRPETVNILLSAARGTLGCGDDVLEALTRGCAREKQVLAPGCASCAAPCGRTADYDMALLRQQDEPTRDAKWAILQALQAYAQTFPAQPDANAVFTAVFALGESWEIRDLLDAGERIRQLTTKGAHQ